MALWRRALLLFAAAAAAATAAGPPAAALAAYAPAAYDPALAMTALWYCKTAYCNASTLVDWTCPTCGRFPAMAGPRVFRNATAKSQALAGFDGALGRVVLAVRGTSNIANWIADLDFRQTGYPRCAGCRVHQGFAWEWQTLKRAGALEYVAALVRRHRAPVLVTGHSLGASVALLAALDVALGITRDVTVYNFGEPRLGNAAFAAYPQTVLPAGRQFRVTHRDDPVPHVPPLSMGFRHAPHELWYDNDGNTSWRDCRDSAAAEDPKCSDSVWLPIAVSDHLRYLGVSTRCELPGAAGQTAAEAAAEAAAEDAAAAPLLRRVFRRFGRQGGGDQELPVRLHVAQ